MPHFETSPATPASVAEELVASVKAIMLSGVDKAYLKKRWTGHYYTPSGSIVFTTPAGPELKLNLWLDSERERAQHQGTSLNVLDAQLSNWGLSDHELERPEIAELATELYLKGNGQAILSGSFHNRLPDPETSPEEHAAYLRVLGNLGMEGIVSAIETGDNRPRAVGQDSLVQLTRYLTDTVLPALQPDGRGGVRAVIAA